MSAAGYFRVGSVVPGPAVGTSVTLSDQISSRLGGEMDPFAGWLIYASVAHKRLGRYWVDLQHDL